MKSVLDYLEETALRFPEKEAVYDGRQRYSFRELLGISRKAGSFLTKVCRQRSPVPVFMEKRAETIGVFLGAVYAGCFYVYLNPEIPLKRIKERLEFLDSDVVIAEGILAERLLQAGFGGRVLGFEELVEEEADMEVLGFYRMQMRPEDYLYGMFTSGSTGVPKLVAVSGGAAVEFAEEFIRTFSFLPQDVIGNQAPFDFDVSVKDLLVSVVCGARLVLIPSVMFATPPALLDYLCENQVTVLIWAASALCVVSAARGLEYRIPGEIRKVFFSGEVMPCHHLRLWREALPEAEFVNLYGPTEITCNCTYYCVDGTEEGWIPIGRPFSNREVFLLDERNQRIEAVGVTGEICVGGKALSSGYYRNKKETEKRFVRNIFGEPGGGIVYRTGDMGHYDEKRLLCFDGRTDHQIKRMGHRIELEEVEWELGNLEGIDRLCCLFDSRTKRLTAYYVGTVSPAGLRKLGKERVPAYMCPNEFIRLKFMPLNKNGKIDRGSLEQYRMKEEICFGRPCFDSGGC